MMERIEYIRKLPKKDLIEFLIQLLDSDQCDSCPIFTHCRRGEGINCETALKLYLESEMAPIPKLQKGDVIAFSDGYEGVYYGDDWVWKFFLNGGHILTNMTDGEYKKIVSVKRADERKRVTEIWRGGM